MIVFSFSRKRENLREFNTRVEEFCTENHVVGVQAQALGPALVLTLTCDEDLPEIVDPLPTYIPVIIDVQGDNLALEEDLQKFVDREAAKDTEDNPRVPSTLVLVPRIDKSTEGWAVVLMITGEVDPDEGEDGGEDEPAPDDAPAEPVAPAFKG